MRINEGHISRDAFKAVVGTFYAVAIVAAATRLVLQVRVYRRLQIEDFFLLGACACLTAATLLTFIKFSDLYYAEVFGLNAGLLPITDDVGQRAYSYEDLCFSAPVLAWTAIFFVKFAYLSFFRLLVTQLKNLTNFRKVLMAIVAISWPVCIISVYIPCTKRGLEAMVCLEPKYMRMSLGLAIFAITLDIITDIMILVIPIYILWRVRIKPFQKVGLGVFLTLNVWMIIIACVRAAKLRSHGFVDVTWLFFWQEMEASIAVVMISLTAFRSIFASHGMRERNAKPWYSSAARRLKGRKMLHSDEPLRLPVVPSATLTGVQTFIQGCEGEGSTASLAYACENSKVGGNVLQSPQKIHVSRSYQVRSEQPPSEFSHV